MPPRTDHPNAKVLIAEGMTAVEAACRIGVIKQTYYRWWKKYGGMQVVLWSLP